jgi:lipoprotein-anchoring transpeptidase ErfK/SrfK
VNARHKSVAVVLFLLLLALAACLPAVAAASEQPALSLSAAPATLTCGDRGSATVVNAAPGASLTLLRKRAGDADFVKIGEATAGADGTFVWSVKPPETTLYRVEQAAGQSWAAASAETTVSVRPKVTLTAAAASPLIEGKYVRYTVSVKPAHTAGTVQLQRRAGAAWQTLADVALGADSTGSVRLLAGKPGFLAVRAQMAADAEHLTGTSAVWKRTVYDKSNPWGVPAKYAHLILVRVHHYKLLYFERGVLIKTFDCVTGRPSLPTPLGHFRIYAKDPHIGGPYGPYRMRYLGLFAIHGTDEPWLLGKYPRNFSHGCTRLSNDHITWLYKRVPVGTPVWNVP